MDNTKHQAEIYAVLDNVAGELLGPIQMHKHKTAAIRFFGDIAGMDNSTIGKHPEDFDLVRLGFLTHDNQLEPGYEVILTGSTWAATQAQPEPPVWTGKPSTSK